MNPPKTRCGDSLFSRIPSLGAVSVLACGGLVLSGCGVIDNLEAFQDDEQQQQDEQQDEQAAPEPDFPYEKEGRVFIDTGNDVMREYGIERLESTDEYTVLDTSTTLLEPLSGSNNSLSSPPRLVDPESGLVYESLYNEEMERPFGSRTSRSSPSTRTRRGKHGVTSRRCPRTSTSSRSPEWVWEL